MERVRCARAMCRGIGERSDNLQLLDDRAGPAVRDNEWQRIVMLRTHVDEVNVESIDRGDELRQGVQPGLALAPVVLGRPIPRDGLSRRELHALRCIGDRLAIGPPCRVDAPAQLGQLRLRNVHLKRTNGGRVSCLLAAFLCSAGWSHGALLEGVLDAPRSQHQSRRAVTVPIANADSLKKSTAETSTPFEVAQVVPYVTAATRWLLVSP